MPPLLQTTAACMQAAPPLTTVRRAVPFMTAVRSGNPIPGTEDYLVRLAYLDGRFYVAYNQSIVSVFTDGTQYSIATLSTFANGIEKKDGNVVYNLYGDIGTTPSLDKKEYFKT